MPWRVAAGATAFIKQPCPPLDGFGLEVPAGGDGQTLCIEGHEVGDLIAYFRLATVGKPVAILLGHAVGCGFQRRGQAHISGERTHALLVDIRLARLPSESSGQRLFRCQIPDPVKLAGDTVAVCIFRVMEGLQVFDGDGFQQTHANHLRRYPG